MYEKKKNRWFKHFDFILLDMIVIEVCYLLVCYLRIGNHWYSYTNLYRTMQFLVVAIDFMIICVIPVHKNILKRKWYQEFLEAFKNVSILVVVIMTYLFFVKQASFFSRGIILAFWVLASIIMGWIRCIYKVLLQKHMAKNGNLSRMLLVTDQKKMVSTMEKMQQHSKNRFIIRAIVIKDFIPEMESEYDGTEIIGGIPELYLYLKDHVVDEIMIDLADTELAERLTQELMITGVTVHINLVRAFGELPNQMIENVGGLMVMTSSLRVASPVQLFLKRIMDIAGSLVGLFFTFIAMIIVGPIIYKQSPGPIFYSQERVGKNGRKFRIYKFRSMYMDADKRKAELMEQNKMDGLMFKMDNDPRIIPIGHLIRKFSIDELPQFFNILKGDMSLVGTRPPTVDEWEQYSPHHRARLCSKPGLTGLWQVSGRSDITDFEEVVRLDLKYIREWSLWLDIKLLFMTVYVVLTGKGSV